MGVYGGIWRYMVVYGDIWIYGGLSGYMDGASGAHGAGGRM